MTDAYGNDAATSTGTIADTTNNAASGAPQRAESTERLARPLIKLAKACGLATSFIDQLGTYTEISDAALVAVLKALDVDASSDEAIVRSMTQLEVENSKRLLPSTIVATTGKPTGITLNCSSDADITASIELEDGTAFGHFALLPNLNSGKPDLTIAPDLPMGYHTLTVTVDGREGKAAIIAAPARIPVPEAVAEHQRWGWMTQMYSVRSRESWGIGDYGDLKRLLADAAEKSKADFMLINPIHAGAPIPPLEPSPYLPESRRFLNVTYIRPQDIPEYATLPADVRAQVDALHDSVAARNDESTPMDINAAWEAKRPALRLIFEAGRNNKRELEFEHFKTTAGPDLDSFATWCLCFEVWGAPWGENRWFFEKTIDDPAVRQLVEEHHDLFEFNRWLQWIAAEQVNAAQQEGAGPRHDTGSDAGHGRGRARARRGCLGQSGTLRLQVASRSAARRTSITSRARIGPATVQPHATWRPPAGVPQMVHSMYEHAGAVPHRPCWACSACGGFRRELGAPQRRIRDVQPRSDVGSTPAIEATRAGHVVVGEDQAPCRITCAAFWPITACSALTWNGSTRVDDSPNAGDPYRAPRTIANRHWPR